MRVARVGFLLLLVAPLLSCDRKSSTIENIPVPEAQAPGPTYELNFQPLAPLERSKPTHVTVDSLGSIYWVQEHETGDDVVFIMGETQIPRPSDLTAVGIAEAMGFRNGSGNVQSLAAG